MCIFFDMEWCCPFTSVVGESLRGDTPLHSCIVGFSLGLFAWSGTSFVARSFFDRLVCIRAFVGIGVCVGGSRLCFPKRSVPCAAGVALRGGSMEE